VEAEAEDPLKAQNEGAIEQDQQAKEGRGDGGLAVHWNVGFSEHLLSEEEIVEVEAGIEQQEQADNRYDDSNYCSDDSHTSHYSQHDEIHCGYKFCIRVNVHFADLELDRIIQVSQLCRLLPGCSALSDRLRMCTYSILPCRRDSMEVVGKSTVTGKYQLTLPKFVREFLRADNGDLIVFIKDHDKILVKRGIVQIEE